MQSDSVSPTSDSESSRIPLVAELPVSLVSERHGEVAVVRLARPHKRNALDSETVSGVERLFSATPETAVRRPQRTSSDVDNPWRCQALCWLIRWLYP
jgi:hypothetical protein